MEAEVNHHPVFLGPTSHAFRRPALYSLAEAHPAERAQKVVLDANQELAHVSRAFRLPAFFYHFPNLRPLRARGLIDIQSVTERRGVALEEY